METEKLHIKKVLPTDYFADDTFNAILDDIDVKVVGISHLVSGEHWAIREPDTNYVRKDVVRWPAMKSHQYAECITAGTTSSADTINNYTTGDIVYDGSVVWRIWSLTEQNDANGGIIKIWLSGYEYKKGDAVLYGKSIYRCTIDHTASSFSTDASKWQEIYASIRPFTVSVYYKTGDTVLQGNLIYKCLTDHVSTNFNADVSNWELVGNLVLLHEWESNRIYHQDEAVVHNGQIYRALSDHTSTTDLETDASNWELVTTSIPLWESDTYYVENSIVHYDNLLYKCVVDHTSGVNFDITKWHVLHDPNAFIRNWTSNTQYYQNQVVRHNGNLYRCNTANNDASFTIAKWDLLTDSINDWVGSSYYVVGQYVNYNGILYKCITANNDANFTISKWQKVSGGGIDSWSVNTDYIVGDVVVYANKIYQCNTSHTSQSTFTPDASKWTEISACITRIPNWVASEDYVVGDLVAYDAKIYRCNTAHTSGSTFNSTEEANWEELSPTINEISTWTPSTDYEIGQLVIYDNKLYRCNTNHTSDSTSFSTDIAYWDSIGASGIDAWKTGEAYQQGNMVVYNDKIYVCDTAHTSASPFDHTKWHEVSTADIKLWTSNIEYLVGNNVIYNNKLYRCTTTHTSTSTFDVTKWEEISPTKLDDWQASTEYSVGDYVVNNNKIYKCTTAHTSTSSFDLSKWAEISSCDIDLWRPDTDYGVGNLVIQDNQLYRCITTHTSDSSDFYADIINWELLDTKWLSENWASSKYYAVGDVVLYDNRLFKCIVANTSSTDFATDYNKWSAIGSKLELWKASTYYAVGDTVIYNNKLYKCKTAHTSTTTLSADIANWDLISSGGIDNWKSNEDYSINNVVIYSNKIYQCKTAHSAGSTFDYSKWKEISSSDIDLWASDFDYVVGDIVIYDNKLYRCITAHTSSLFNTDISNWASIISPPIVNNWQPSGNYLANQLLEQDGVLYRTNKIFTGANVSDISSNTTDIDLVFANIRPWTDNTYYVVGSVVYYGGCIYKCNTTHTSNEFIKLTTKYDGAANLQYKRNGFVIEINNTEHVFDIGSICDLSYVDVIGGELHSDQEYVSSLSVYYSVDGVEYILAGTRQASRSQSIPKFNRFDFNFAARYVKVVMEVLDHISGGSAVNWWFNTVRIWSNISNWELLSNIPPWMAYTMYKKDDLVVNYGYIYRCIYPNSDSSFDYSKWERANGYRFWVSSENYLVGDIVLYNDCFYRCITSHTSSEFNSDYSKWTQLDKNCFIYDWEADTPYYTSEVVKYGDYLYRCVVQNVSAVLEPPVDATIYKSTTDVIYVDNTTTIPYSETIDLGSVKKVTDFTYNEVTTDMSFTYNIETSEDNITFSPWAGTKTSVRYIKLTVDSVSIDTGAVSPNAYLGDFTVIGESDNWEKLSSGGADIYYATDSDIDGLFN